MNEQKLLPCPFCGNPDVQIWEQAPGLYYVCCNGQKGGCGARTTLCEREKSAVNEWNRRATLPDNKALTVEELRGMDGQPVYLTITNGANGPLEMWALVDVVSDTGSFWLRNSLGGRSCYHSDADLQNSGIVAYRLPPEKGD